MSARARAGDAELVRLHAVFCGVVAHEPDSPMNVLLDFRNGESGLRTMHDGENRVAAVEQDAIKAGVDRVMTGGKPAADHEQNAAAVLIFRLKDVERQGRAKFAAIDHVFDTVEPGLCL